jgi:hypothetical protein
MMQGACRFGRHSIALYALRPMLVTLFTNTTDETAIEEQHTSNTLALYALRPMLVTLFTRLVFPTRCMGLTHRLLCLPCSWHAW